MVIFWLVYVRSGEKLARHETLRSDVRLTVGFIGMRCVCVNSLRHLGWIEKRERAAAAVGLNEIDKCIHKLRRIVCALVRICFEWAARIHRHCEFQIVFTKCVSGSGAAAAATAHNNDVYNGDNYMAQYSGMNDNGASGRPRRRRGYSKCQVRWSAARLWRTWRGV